MKTRSRNGLRTAIAFFLGFVLFTGIYSMETSAAEVSTLAELNAGAAEALDSIDAMTMDEVTELVTLEKEKLVGTLVVAKVNEYLTIREQPNGSAKKLGYMYADCGGTVLEQGNGWTKVQSGNLTGWANSKYLYFEEEAQAMAEEIGIYQATVNADGLRIRKEPNTEAEIWAVASNGEVYQAVSEHFVGQWIAIEYGGALGYIAKDFVTLEFTMDKGETLEEIKVREERERKERQKLLVKEGASVIGTTDEMLLAALIQCEAGNQPYEGQVAVGAVVMNRVNSGAYPNSITGVIYASGQFSPARTGKVEELALNGVKESCLQAARAAMAGESTVGGAMHFRRVGKHEGQIIGDHVFW